MPRKRGESGQFVEAASFDDVLDVFDEVDGPPVVTSADVADATGLSRDGARRKLKTLVDRGDVARRSTAGRVLYWRVADVAERRRESAESAPVSNSDREGVGEGERRDERARGGEQTAETDAVGIPDDVEAAIADLDLPGSGAKLDARRDGVRDLFEHLREQGSASRSDFETIVDADDVRYGSFSSFWNNCVLDRDALASLPGVEAPGEGEHNWYYTGDR